MLLQSLPQKHTSFSRQYQVNQQRKEYEDAVRRFTRDAYIVKKYQESCASKTALFEPIEEVHSTK